MTTQKELEPAKVLGSQYKGKNPRYLWKVYDPKDTNLKLVVLEDTKTGVSVSTTEANPKVRTAADRAWASARHSRAAGPAWVIRREMGSKGVDPDQKLEETFKGYGHASPADAARLDVNFDNVPMHFPMALFNFGFINSGQEKSTRYQTRFVRGSVHPLANYLPRNTRGFADIERQYQRLGNMAMKRFSSAKEVTTTAFKDFYKPDPDNKAHESALTSRVLDTARAFLPLGVGTGMAFETSARDWSRIIGVMRASPFGLYREIADQTHQLLAPSRWIESHVGFKAEAPGLIRHSEADPTVNDNLKTLKDFLENQTGFRGTYAYKQRKYFQDEKPLEVDRHFDAQTEGDRMVGQYIVLLYPGTSIEEVTEWAACQPQDIKIKIGEIIKNGHDHHHELPPMARTTRMSILMKGSISEDRDWNRQKSTARFMPIPQFFGLRWDADTATQIFSNGYTLPAYLTEVADLSGLTDSYVDGLTDYFDEVRRFIDLLRTKYQDSIDYGFFINLIPLSAHVDLVMHGDPRSWDYINSLRVRPGGQINYRLQAYHASNLLALSDPYLGAFRQTKAPDPTSREEFFDRS